MNVTELRIGNLVESSYMMKEFEETIVSSNHLSFLEDGVHHFVRLKPIPLTEEWLEKFGFDNILNTKNYQITIGKGLTFSIAWNGTFCITSIYVVSGPETFIMPANIKYVHQLQNLYHSLTGEELKVKELV